MCTTLKLPYSTATASLSCLISCPPRRRWVIGVLCLCVSLPVSGRNWVEVKTDHFLLRTDVSLDLARAKAEELEKFRFMLGKITSLHYHEQKDRPLKVYAYKSTHRYERTFGMQGTLGFFQRGASRSAAVFTLQKPRKVWEPTGSEVMFHELTHYLLDHYSAARYPVWYNEGFAEYLSTIAFKDGYAIVGAAVANRLLVLRHTNKWMKMRDLLAAKARYIKGHAGAGFSVNSMRRRVDIYNQYAQGWFMVHFLNSSDRFRAGIAPYLKLINEDADLEPAFRQAFGIDYDAMDDILRKYWYAGKLPLLYFNLKDKIAPIHSVTRTLAPVEAQAIHEEARFDTGSLSGGDRKTARKAFSRVLQANIRPLDMHMHLAELAFADEDWDDSERHVDAVLSIRSDHAPALTLKAKIARARLTKEHLSVDEVETLSAMFARAVQADRFYLPALMGYAGLYLQDSVAVSDQALEVVDAIRAAAPKDPTGAELRARLLARNGDYARALEIAHHLVNWAETGKIERHFRKLEHEIEAMEASSQAG